MSRSSAPAVRVDDAVPVFAALADATRLRLIRRLAAGEPLSISQLSEGASVTRQAITRHLETLNQAGLVKDVRRGRERVWELDRKRVERAQRYLDQVAAQWDAAAERLKAFVESSTD
jgi:DNA-binding transcriptional ArsR family regulator